MLILCTKWKGKKGGLPWLFMKTPCVHLKKHGCFKPSNFAKILIESPLKNGSEKTKTAQKTKRIKFVLTNKYSLVLCGHEITKFCIDLVDHFHTRHMS